MAVDDERRAVERDEVESLAVRVRDARMQAGLTQLELAKRLGVSQTLVSQAECGRTRVGWRYVLRVVDACGVGACGVGARVVGVESRREAPPEKLPRDWTQNPRYCSGIDPDEIVPVRRGSARDLELLRSYPRWRMWAQVEVYAQLYDAAALESALASSSQERVDNAARPERPERAENEQRAARPERLENEERAKSEERAERPERLENEERAERPECTENEERAKSEERRAPRAHEERGARKE